MDSARGIGCLIVLLAHVGSLSGRYGAYFNGCGKIGVWLFFVLSGYWFMAPLCKAYKPLNKQNVGIFYIKKLLRLFPVYGIVLLMAWLVGFLPDMTTVIRHFFMMEGQAHFWYMPVIAKFYLIAPLFWMLRNVFRKDSVFVGVLLAIGIGCVLLFPYTEYPENTVQLWWYLPVFGMGFFLAVLKGHGKGRRKTNPVWPDMAVPLAVTAMVLFTPWFREVLWGEPPSSYLQNKYMLMGGLWFIVVFAVPSGSLWKNLLEKSRILQWVGDISFPLYLVHYPIMRRVGLLEVSWGAKAVLIIIISVVLAWLLHVFVEKPVGNLYKD